MDVEQQAPQVIVLGSINQDIVVTTESLPVAGATVFGDNSLYSPGGKGANQAVAAALSGASTRMIGAVGDDGPGRSLRDFLRTRRVNVDAVRIDESAATGTALITVDAAGENTIVVVSGANSSVAYDEGVVFKSGDVVVAQYEVPEKAIVKTFVQAKAQSALTILNPAPAATIDDHLLAVTDICVVNETELAEICGVALSHSPAIEHVCIAARSIIGKSARRVVVTLGRRGSVLVTRDAHVAIAGIEVDAVDTTGAGDCFVGAMAAQLVAGEPLERAMSYANCAAALSTTRVGAAVAMPSHGEVAGRLSADA